MCTTDDQAHLMDLLELLPWEATSTREGARWHLNCPQLWAVLTAHQTSWLVNGILDYVYCHRRGDNTGLITRLSMSLLDVFEDPTPEIATAVGEAVGHGMGLHAPPAAIGRRWCADLTATAWRIRVPFMAGAIRTGRSGACLTPRSVVCRPRSPSSAGAVFRTADRSGTRGEPG